METETLSERIGLVIQALGMRKTAFAEKLGVTQAFISRITTGVGRPSDRTISDICRLFNVSEIWLRTGEGEMFSKKSKEEEIGAFLGDVISGNDDFKQAFIATLANLTDSEWQVLQNIVFSVVANHQEIQSRTKKGEP